MGPIELARWQWSDYASTHQDGWSLRLHLMTIPLFWTSLLAILSWPWHGSGLVIALGVAGITSVFALQGAGHKREKNPPKPFTSTVNAIARLFMEQLVTLPRYVLSGQALRVARTAVRPSASGEV